MCIRDRGMISYKPYRDVSAKFFAMLGSLELASVVEKGSIDEAYILCSTSGPSVATGVQSPKLPHMQATISASRIPVSDLAPLWCLGSRDKL